MKQIFDVFKYCFVDFLIQKDVKKLYYKKSSNFKSIDQSITKAYLLRNPYKISKTYLRKNRAKDLHTYGETPLVSYEVIAKKVGLQRRDVFLELGSGRGRGLFFLNHFFQCSVVGIERIPLFVQLANKIIKKHDLDNISILYGDMTTITVPKATVVYLYGTCLSENEILRLIHQFKFFNIGTKVISISYPLTNYDQKSFQLEKTFSISFPWGETEAYLQILTK